MKIDKNIYIYVGVAVVVVGVVWFAINRPNKSDIADSTLNGPSLNTSPSQSPSSSLSPRITLKSPKPTPGLTAQEARSYESWAEFLGPLNRHLILDKDCTSIVPSQVAYPNNTQIMIDNGYSAKSRILKIGGREYSLDAGGWVLATLSSTTLPAELKIFCGQMELGQLDLK